MGSTIRKRQRYETFLSEVKLLKDLDKWERHSIADALEPCEFQDGEVGSHHVCLLVLISPFPKLDPCVFAWPSLIWQVVLKQGDKGDLFFIIVEGKATVTQTNDKGESGVVAELGSAQYFGLLQTHFVIDSFSFCLTAR
jgi:cAMP-dependent protein kinase regulator